MRYRLTPRQFTVLVALLGLLLVGFYLWILLRRSDTAGLASSAGPFLTGLALLNLLLMAVLLFVLFRELVKGYLSWRRQREGARFRTRLLTAFVLLGLVPSVLLFVSGILLIQATVDRWFQSPVHGLTTASQELVDRSLDLVREGSLRKAKALAFQLRQIPAELRPSLAAQNFAGGDLDAFVLVLRDGTVAAKGPATTPAPEPYKVSKVFSPQGLAGYMDLRPSPMIWSGVQVDEKMGILVGVRLPEALYERARYISENHRAYLQLRTRQQLLRTTMISSFLALTLLVIFAAVWIGTHLSREISVPLQLLLEGTQALSAGNLAHRIAYEAKDEIGMVVASFNEMASEVEAGREELERRNRALHQATEEAEGRRRYIEALLETLDIGVVSLDVEGQIRTLNPKAREILGLDPHEPARNALTRPEWAPLQALLTPLPQRPVQNREVTLATRRGHLILAVTATPLEGHGSLGGGTLVILEDITDLSRAQRIAAWQEAAQRMAHEIKNPLTPIRLSAQRMRKKAQEQAADLTAAVLEGATAIEREVEAMSTMVSEFSRFARLPEIRPKPASLPALIEGVLAPYRSAAEIELDIPPGFPPVRLDAEQMGRVLKNLLENAIQAMDGPGRIVLTLREREGKAVLTLRDTGPGIPPEARSRLFTPYFSTKRKGTGLGLAIVARILEEHGGTIRVDETYTEGAGFVVTLPL
ncbi:MAG: ATP-binding protein [Acidobacteriota bacterium]